MTNHPNRGPKGPASNPAPDDIIKAREATGMTQSQFAAVIHATQSAVQKWEDGSRRMHPGLWELFQIKTAK